VEIIGSSAEFPVVASNEGQTELALPDMNRSYWLKFGNRHPLLKFLLGMLVALVVITVIRSLLIYFGINPFHILDADW
jgi:hypothetical protein